MLFPRGMCTRSHRNRCIRYGRCKLRNGKLIELQDVITMSMISRAQHHCGSYRYVLCGDCVLRTEEVNRSCYLHVYHLYLLRRSMSLLMCVHLCYQVRMKGCVVVCVQEFLYTPDMNYHMHSTLHFTEREREQRRKKERPQAIDFTTASVAYYLYMYNQL